MVSVRLLDGGGEELVGAAGPYPVGARPTLTCRVVGGVLRPSLTWWRDGRLLDASYHRPPQQAR